MWRRWVGWAGRAVAAAGKPSCHTADQSGGTPRSNLNTPTHCLSCSPRRQEAHCAHFWGSLSCLQAKIGVTTLSLVLVPNPVPLLWDFSVWLERKSWTKMGTWVDLSKEMPGGSNSPARTTPVPFGGESDYMRMLREAQVTDRHLHKNLCLHLSRPLQVRAGQFCISLTACRAAPIFWTLKNEPK